MTSILKSRQLTPKQSPLSYEGSGLAKSICFVVGLVCVGGFLVDLLVLGMPPDPFALEWRVSFLQQAGDRSIVFLFGVALLLYSNFDNRRLKRPFAFFCLATGVAMLLSSGLVIRDNLILKEQAFEAISTQEEQLQAQIDETLSNPDLEAELTPGQLRQASQEISSRAQNLKQTSRQGITKSGIASLGNLVVVGLGLIGLSRIGLKRR